MVRLRGIIPKWPQDSGEWNIIIYPDGWRIQIGGPICVLKTSTWSTWGNRPGFSIWGSPNPAIPLWPHDFLRATDGSKFQVCPTKSCSPKRSCFADVSSMCAERKRHSEEFGSRWQSLSTSIGWNFNDSRYFVIKTMGSHYVSNIWNQTFGSTFPTHPALAPYGTSVWSSACSNASARSLSPKETMGLCQLIPKPEFHACEILPTPSEMKKISNFIDTCSLIFMF